MLDTLLSIAQDNPILFGVVAFNVFVVGYILVYFSLYLYKRRHPEIMLNVLLWKSYVRKAHSCSTVEDLYARVMERLKKERILSKKDGTGKLARDKSLLSLAGEERTLLQEIYALYEQKTYGSKPIEGEDGAVRVLLNRLLSV